jgi:hypothetical protein
MASREPSRKLGREEVPPPPPAEPEEVPPPPHAEPEEVLPHPPTEPEEVSPPPPEEVRRLKPPRSKVSPPLRASKVNFEDACFSVKMLYQAWQSLGKMVVHLGVQRPTDLLQTIMMDYAFKVNVLDGKLEREVVPPDDDDDGGLDVSTSDSDSDGGLLRRRLPLLNYTVAVHNELQCVYMPELCQKFVTLLVLIIRISFTSCCNEMSTQMN